MIEGLGLEEKVDSNLAIREQIDVNCVILKLQLLLVLNYYQVILGYDGPAQWQFSHYQDELV